MQKCKHTGAGPQNAHVACHIIRLLPLAFLRQLGCWRSPVIHDSPGPGWSSFTVQHVQNKPPHSGRLKLNRRLGVQSGFAEAALAPALRELVWHQQLKPTIPEMRALILTPRSRCSKSQKQTPCWMHTAGILLCSIPLALGLAHMASIMQERNVWRKHSWKNVCLGFSAP